MPTVVVNQPRGPSCSRPRGTWVSASTGATTIDAVVVVRRWRIDHARERCSGSK